MKDDSNDGEVTVPPHVDGSPINDDPESSVNSKDEMRMQSNALSADEIGTRETSFDPSEGSGKKWQELNRYDKGMFNPTEQWEKKQRKYHQRRDIEHMASILRLEDHVEEVVAIIEDFDQRSSRESYEAMALAAFTLACNHYDFDIRAGRPFSDEQYVDKYEELREVNDVPKKQIRRLRTKMASVPEVMDDG